VTVSFERGYKTWCERFATEIRGTLGHLPTAPLDTHALAKHLGVRVWTPHDVPNLSEESRSILLRNDGKTPSCWSAVTLVVGKKVVVVLNSSHSAARQASDLAHELAHRIRGHEAKEVDVTEDGIMLLRSYDKVQEEEADWLSGCLLLPRESLLAIRRSGLDDVVAAEEYGVSVTMLKYRIARTGVNRQIT
jgi:Zn-dependent peptidase ImmA (M78 family)